MDLTKFKSLLKHTMNPNMRILLPWVPSLVAMGLEAQI